MATQRPVTIGLVELPELGLFDVRGHNWAQAKAGLPLVSKQILLSNLQGHGYDAQLVNMKDSDEHSEYGRVEWGGHKMTKVYIGRKIESLDADEYDIWGITSNFSQHQEVACMTIKHLAAHGKPVIVGGSDAIADPDSDSLPKSSSNKSA